MNAVKLATAALATLVLGAGAHALAQTATPAVPAPTQTQTASVAAPMAIPELVNRLSGQGYSDISEIERKGDKLYEVKARDAQGRKLEMKVDARTAEILHSEQD
ncbi:hypothetical protein J2847_000938 [Azospirillum agricola]|uniref:PepSY domain-containing protein n=1 Tax=Azospirillum agricola TaxID=1720247 RepID=UPI001AE49256|nr:PepSY domain-containing protein [Azospirillum agricola]MBP2227656.1 hypothetical protein [Azospirillum agricola]